MGGRRVVDARGGLPAASLARRGDLTLVDYVEPVLVVDDLNTMTRIVEGMLRKCGFQNVDQCHDGPTALQKMREKSYLFVITDREMPGMNGLELAREIRGDPKIRSVPLVIMSASSEAKHAEAAMAAGANFFMTKPFNLTTGRDHRMSCGPA
jgi:two-component system, chemotaxis family, chemotaxis protein CheY